MTVHPSSCLELVCAHSRSELAVREWLANLLAQGCTSHGLPSHTVGRFGPDVHDVAPNRAPTATPGTLALLKELSDYADLVHDLLPERVDDLLASDFEQAVEEARLLSAGVGRIRTRRDNVVFLDPGRRLARHA